MLRKNEVRRPNIDSLSRLPQIQLTLREIRCNALEKELKMRYEELKTNRMKLSHKIEKKEKMLKAKENQLAKLEYKLWIREQSISLNNTDCASTAVVSPSSVNKDRKQFWKQEEAHDGLSPPILEETPPIILSSFRKRSSRCMQNSELDSSVDSQWIYSDIENDPMYRKRQKI
mmetsp:Transcript_26986/g.62079  ORF Transcript_26986/g.62079 Transcript_26986/m.62079 type:complete len:173 (-) Transcript_26986:127-645(-)